MGIFNLAATAPTLAVNSRAKSPVLAAQPGGTEDRPHSSTAPAEPSPLELTFHRHIPSFSGCRCPAPSLSFSATRQQPGPTFPPHPAPKPMAQHPNPCSHGLFTRIQTAAATQIPPKEPFRADLRKATHV